VFPQTSFNTPYLKNCGYSGIWVWACNN